jgi:hypothetical protein
MPRCTLCDGLLNFLDDLSAECASSSIAIFDQPATAIFVPAARRQGVGREPGDAAKVQSRDAQWISKAA